MELVGHLDVAADGDRLGFEYRVTNPGNDPVTLAFHTGQRFEIEVIPADGRTPVWRASDGRMYPMVLGSITIEPGDSIAFEEHMPRPDPGRYTAVATLVAREADALAEATIDLE